MTEGAACTPLLAKNLINNNDSLLIANSDQYVEWDSSKFMYSMAADQIDGGILTFKNSDLKETISKIDIKNLILETDSPYLSPEPLRGKTNNPSNLIIIAKKLAEINSIPLDVVCQVTSENTSNLFSLNS